MLKNLLADAGVRAVVINNAYTRNGVEVIVNQDDVHAAWRIADEFNRQEQENQSKQAEELVDFEADEPSQDHWPTCPRCDRRRTTVCPSCGNSGTHFKPADRMPEEMENDDPSLGVTRLCPTCDESFSPRYRPICEWCNHVFDADASLCSENIINPAEPFEKMDFRVVMILIALIGFIAAVATYFTLLFRQ